MWSFEKIHRCMAHLFLGQLVATFDEEFRILYAQSQPLIITPVEDISLLQKRQYPSERVPLYRDPRKFLNSETGHPEERMDMDWRMMVPKRKDSSHNPADLYSRYTPQQSRMDPSFEQGHPRIPGMENPAFKRHSYAEGVSGRYQFLSQQGMPDAENHGRQFNRQQQPYQGPAKETDSGAYEKFWNQDFHVSDQYSEPGVPQEMDRLENFDPVLNYLSSTRNVDFDQGSDKLTPAADLSPSSSYPRRMYSGQPYACQKSPTASNPTEQKQFFLEPNSDRKDPVVKRGLRDWRISSYLSAYDEKGDESLPFGPTNVSDPFDEPSSQQTTAQVINQPTLKIPNVREFKIPTIPRASQMPSYAKNMAQDQPKKQSDEPPGVEDTKTTRTPSESSLTTEGEKTEEAEQKEPKTSGFHREDPFRRKYNAAVPRSSRLRSSLIFSSLDQQHNSQDGKTTGQQDEESDKNETEQAKQPLFSQVLSKRRSHREPFEWKSYMKSTTFDNSATDSLKAEDKDSSKDDNSKDLSRVHGAQESLKQTDVEQTVPSPSVEPTKSLLASEAYVDMNDPNMRLMFFKELAAKRKAAQAAEQESKDSDLVKPPAELKNKTTVTKEEPCPEKPTEKMSATTKSAGLSEKSCTADVGKKVCTDACKSVSQSLEASDKTNKEFSGVKIDSSTTKTSTESKITTSADSEMMGVKSSQPATTLPLSSVPEKPQSKPLEKPKLSSPTVENSGKKSTTPPDVPASSQGAGECEESGLAPAQNKPSSLTPSSVKILPSSGLALLDSSTQRPESVTEVTTISQSGVEISQKSISPTESDSTQPHQDSVSQLTASATPSAVDSTGVKSDVALERSVSGSEPNTISSPSITETDSEKSRAPTTSEKNVPESENGSALDVLKERPEVFRSSEDVQADTTAPSLNPALFETSLSQLTDLESKSASNQKKITASTPSPADPSSEHSLEETKSPVHSGLTTTAPQPEKCPTPQDPPQPVKHPSELKLKEPVSPSPAETISSASLTGSDEPVLSHQDENTLSPLQSPSNCTSKPEHDTANSNKSPLLPTTETCGPTESISDAPTESDQPEKTREVVTSETDSSESPVPTESSKQDSQSKVSEEPEIPDTSEEKNNNTDATIKVNPTTMQESSHSDKTNDQLRQKDLSELPENTSSEVVPLSPQSKQTKSSQPRYLSSTANVLSSSNLRDDTKLLLEQISANSQSRNEMSKESPVTDDEKEDEADKNAKREKERQIRSFIRGQPKSSQERDKALERIQSMRKERKVYSRFEV